MKTYVHLYKFSLHSSYNEKSFRQNFWRKSKRTFYVQWLFPENVVKSDRPQMKIRRMRICMPDN